jgi:hypothetical protein
MSARTRFRLEAGVVFLLVAIGSFLFSRLAQALDSAPVDDPVTALLIDAFTAISHGQWWPLAGIGLMLAIWALRAAAMKWPSLGLAWVNTDAGGFWTSVILAGLGGVTHALAAGVPLDASVAQSALRAFATSAVAHLALRKGAGVKLPMPKSSAVPNGSTGGAS